MQYNTAPPVIFMCVIGTFVLIGITYGARGLKLRTMTRPSAWTVAPRTGCVIRMLERTKYGLWRACDKLHLVEDPRPEYLSCLFAKMLIPFYAISCGDRLKIGNTHIGTRTQRGDLHIQIGMLHVKFTAVNQSLT